MTVIRTLTLNPSLDRTYEVDSLQVGEYNRGSVTSVDLGGKGINVSRNLQSLGVPSEICGFFGGHTGKAMVEELEKRGFPLLPLWLEEETRSNVTLMETSLARMTKLNEFGPSVPIEKAEEMLDLVRGATHAGDSWVMSGSMPPGLPDTFYGSLVTVIRDAGGISYLDTSGKPLQRALEAGPDVLKINHLEAGDVLGQVLEHDDDFIAALRTFRESGIDLVMISSGKDGGWLGTGEVWHHVAAPDVNVRNAVGAGDAMMAACIYAGEKGLDPLSCLRWGVAAGSVSCQLEGTAVVEPEVVRSAMSRTTDSTGQL